MARPSCARSAEAAEDVAQDGGPQQDDQGPEHGSLAAHLVAELVAERVQLGLEAGDEVGGGHVLQLLHESIGVPVPEPGLAQQEEEAPVVGIGRLVGHPAMRTYRYTSI